MNSGGMDAVQLALVSTAVTTAVKLIQAYVHLGGVKSLALYLGTSLIGVIAWTVSQPTAPDRTWVFGLLAAWFVIATAAAGVSNAVDKATNDTTAGK